MILYIIGVTFLLILLFFIFIRLKFKFWAIQPVFHVYDIYYWFVNVGIIREMLPEKNKYTNFKNVTTKMVENVDELTKKQIYLLILLNYMTNGENKYSPKMENILPYFSGHNHKCFWTYWVEKELILDNKNNKTLEESKVIGVITSRPLQVIINNGRKDSEFDLYYVDYLCVNKNWRKRNIAPQLIQTHEYNQSYNNKKIVVSLFKREEELTGIVPLTVYKTYCFDMRKMTLDEILPSKYTLLVGDKQNLHYFYDFLKRELTRFEIVIYPYITNLMELLVTKNIYIRMILFDDEIIAVYIFRKTCTYIDGDNEVLTCIMSIKTSQITIDAFNIGFKMAIYDILLKESKYVYLSVEDLSDNGLLVSSIAKTAHPMIISPMAYFFYNFAYNSFHSSKCVILN